MIMALLTLRNGPPPRAAKKIVGVKKDVLLPRDFWGPFKTRQLRYKGCEMNVEGYPKIGTGWKGPKTVLIGRARKSRITRPVFPLSYGGGGVDNDL
jgi:hypothetical protein